MFAIAKKQLYRTNNTIPYNQWCIKHIIPANFETKGFEIFNIEKKDNINPRYLSSIEIKRFGDKPIDFTGSNISRFEPSHWHSHLPFGVPKNDFIYNIFMVDIYCNGPNGNMPSNNVTCSMLMAIMRCVIYEMSRTDINVDLDKEKYYIQILLSMYHTLKHFMQKEKIYRDLVDSLSNCVLTRDTIQREIAIIAQRGTITDAEMEQLLLVAFSRSIKYFKESHPDMVYTLKDKKCMRAKFGIFMIVPLLCQSRDYSEESINKFASDLNMIYNKMYMTGIINRVEREPDNDFAISGEFCNVLNEIMIDTFKFNIPHKNAEYFVNLIKKAMASDIKDMDELVCASPANPVGPADTLIKPIHCKERKGKTLFAHIDHITETETTIRSPRITKIATFKLTPQENQIIGITWDIALGVRIGSSTPPIINVFMGADQLDITKKMNSCYDLINGIVYNENKKMIGKTEHIDRAIIRKIGKNIEIYTNAGQVIFECNELIVSFKNVTIKINENL